MTASSCLFESIFSRDYLSTHTVLLLRVELAWLFGALGYCAVSEVKLVLQISEATWDSELTACVTSASALVDGLLAREGLIVPSPTPQVIVDAAKFFAAWDFRRRRDPVGAEAFWVEANRLIGVYVEAERQPYVGSA
ncbi:MAG: hypothetical protein NWE94_04770 [Candidatus Bathyarchaeota archaeon]|nr:hypothetical protein [Candidatus Bathyarchaeota archaeon]